MVWSPVPHVAGNRTSKAKSGSGCTLSVSCTHSYCSSISTRYRPGRIRYAIHSWSYEHFLVAMLPDAHFEVFVTFCPQHTWVVSLVQTWTAWMRERKRERERECKRKKREQRANKWQSQTGRRLGQQKNKRRASCMEDGTTTIFIFPSARHFLSSLRNLSCQPVSWGKEDKYNSLTILLLRPHAWIKRSTKSW